MIDNFKQVFERIRQHYAHACEKHPKFCNLLVPTGSIHNYDYKPNWTLLADEEKSKIKFYFSIQKCDSKRILIAELYEIYAACKEGNYEQAEYEVYDAIAVLLRILDMIKEKEAENEN